MKGLFPSRGLFSLSTTVHEIVTTDIGLLKNLESKHSS